MMWTTWRQHRAEAGVAGILLVVLLGGLLEVGHRARQRASALGLPACLRSKSDCSVALTSLHRDFHSIPPFTGFLVALPLLAGMFWAAPLVSREYEAGTHRLAWSQSVSPRQWMLAKIALVFGSVSLAALAVGLVATWALDPLSPAFGGRFNSTWYDVQGIVPVACMLFALAAGLLASVVLRRTIPAMAVTLVVYAAARIPVHWIRGHFAPVATLSGDRPMALLLTNLQGAPIDVFRSLAPPDALVRGTTLSVEPGGTSLSSHLSSIDLLHRYCPSLQVTRARDGSIHASNTTACRTALHDLSLRATTSFQPASHFWAIQAVELAVFAALAAMLAGLAVLLVASRRAV